MLKNLSQEERVQLMRFVCSFAWADLRVRAEERAFVRKMADKLDLDAAETAMVEEWLKVPPRAEDVDPNRVPKAHRQLFLDAARAVISIDGKVDSEELDSLRLFESLLR